MPEKKEKLKETSTSVTNLQSLTMTSKGIF